METCFIGVAGGNTGHFDSTHSIYGIARRPGDAPPTFGQGTKGYEVRQILVNKFMDSKHDWLLLLDHDMIFENDTLEKLRSRDKPFISGLYMRRNWRPISPVWHRPFKKWPMMPWIGDPAPGMLHEIGASGWGCMLMHREVIEKTRIILKGEPEIIEDDMDVWPYDLAAVLRGDEQLRPLRVDKRDIVGSDVRFPFYAKAAGITLWGDPDVRPKHILDYPLSPDDYGGVPSGERDEIERNTLKKWEELAYNVEKLQQQLVEKGDK